MVLNALKHGEECLFYMAGIRDQSVFNFVAIPQSMAIATLELVFRNPAIFERNVKITKGDACQLMTESTQILRVVCEVFKRYARRIHKKNDPRDPNYLAISAACGKACNPPCFLTLRRHDLSNKSKQIEQFIESIFPTQDPKKIAAAKKSTPEAPGMDSWEAVFLVLSALSTLVLMGLLMVSCSLGISSFSAPLWSRSFFFTALTPIADGNCMVFRRSLRHFPPRPRPKAWWQRQDHKPARKHPQRCAHDGPRRVVRCLMSGLTRKQISLFLPLVDVFYTYLMTGVDSVVMYTYDNERLASAFGLYELMQRVKHLILTTNTRLVLFSGVATNTCISS
jgi:hypothetical protein